MKLLYEGSKVQVNNEFKQTQETFTQVFYGLKYFIWNRRNKSEIVKMHKANGFFDQFIIAKGTRQADGFYSKDEVDWNAYNQFAWNEFSNNYNENAKLPEGTKTVKQIAEKKRELLLYFIEHYLKEVKDLGTLNTDPMRASSSLKTDCGITVSLNKSKDIFSVKSPSGGIEIVVKEGEKLTMINHKDENIVFPADSIDMFQKMLEIAKLIYKDPVEARNNPYTYLELDPEIHVVMQNVQKFLIKVNDEHLAKKNAEEQKEQQLTHDNYSRKVRVIPPSVKKPETINDKKANKQKYPCNNFHIFGNGNHYYGVDAKKYLSWLTKEEIEQKFFDWFIKTDKFENIIDIAYYPTITAVDTQFCTKQFNLKKKSFILWIPEQDYQQYYSSNLSK